MRPKVYIDQIYHEEGSDWHLASSCGQIGNGFSIDLRIFDHGTSKARLRAAFSSQIASVTLPDDLAAFETLVRSAKKALKSAGEVKHTRALEGLWAAERSRLEARWAEIEASGVSADQVVLAITNSLASPSLVYRTTSISRRISRYDKDDIWGVCWDADGQPKVLGSH